MKKKNRRISFSRTNQVKEFQPGANNLTLWNDTYEEEKSNASASSSSNLTSSSSNMTSSNSALATPSSSASGANRVKVLQAGVTSSVSLSAQKLTIFRLQRILMNLLPY